MREIKFQYIYELLGTICRPTLTLKQIEEGLASADSFPSSAKIIAKRQFTGLQDKSGVDIYEGDIVNSSGNNSLYVISFGLHSLTGFYYDEEDEEVSCTGFFCSRQGIYSDDIESLCNKSNIYLEVIGNIHENPELLEK